MLTKVELAERHFLEERMGDVSTILDELKRVASIGPGNLQAAEAVMKSTSKMLIEYVIEHAAEMNKNNRCGATTVLSYSV